MCKKLVIKLFFTEVKFFSICITTKLNIDVLQKYFVIQTCAFLLFQVLLKLLMVKTPITEADAIRALACKVSHHKIGIMWLQ